jgi:hypothetical protein
MADTPLVLYPNKNVTVVYSLQVILKFYVMYSC